jgi:hypothetical protein
MSLRNEWWIMPDGDVVFADGDVGDKNHSVIACEAALYQVANAVGQDVDIEHGCNLDSVVNSYAEEHELTGEHDGDVYDQAWDGILNILTAMNVPEPMKLMSMANASDDGREYAEQHWGWKRVHGCNIESWALAPADLDIIERGLAEIWEQEGGEDEGLDDTELSISTFRGPRLQCTYRELCDRSFARGAEHEDGETARQQVRKLDVDAQPGFYGTHLGDCSPARFCRLLESCGVDMQALKAAARKIRHCGDYGTLFLDCGTGRVCWNMGDSDGPPDYTSSDEIKELLGGVHGVTSVECMDEGGAPEGLDKVEY